MPTYALGKVNRVFTYGVFVNISRHKCHSIRLNRSWLCLFLILCYDVDIFAFPKYSCFMENHFIVYVVDYSDPTGRAINVIPLIEFVLYRVALFLHGYCSVKYTFIYIMDKKLIKRVLLWYISSIDRKLILEIRNHLLVNATWARWYDNIC